MADDDSSQEIKILQEKYEYHRKRAASYAAAIRALEEGGGTANDFDVKQRGKYYGWQPIRDAIADYLRDKGEVDIRTMVSEMIAEDAIFGRAPKDFVRNAKTTLAQNKGLFVVNGDKVSLKKKKVAG